jgi:hypothetical protein
MSRFVLSLFLAVFGLTVLTGPAPAGAAPVAVHQVSVSGTDVGMYPAFAPEIERYAITTKAASGGAVTVTATTDDPEGTVLVNGRPATGPTLVEGLEGGDEISVIFQDSDGTSVHSLVYLPAGFPLLEVTANEPGTSPGMVGLTLNKWDSSNEPTYETAVDRNGVPVYVRSSQDSPMDFKLQPNGSYTSSRATRTPGRTGHELVELDDQFREVASYETEGLVNTDGHDSLLLPDGSRFLIAYEPNSESGLTDSVIQEFDPSGDLVWEWNSADHVDIDAESTLSNDDYAHVNSIQVMEDGDILASFRHLSSVWKIARTAHDGFEVGDVVWRLGGRISDFAFVDDPHPGGPCAQHTATELPNGNILLFDNGSGWLGQVLCVNPADPSGDSVSRGFTRVTEYALDEAAGTATLVWDYQPTQPRGAVFAGSAERLPNGNTLIGWAFAREASTSEVSPEGELLWELRDPAPQAQRHISYRSDKFDVPDATDPEVTVDLPSNGTSYTPGSTVTADYSCTDRGGSSLQSCTSDAPDGLLDTSTVGRHSFTVTATDGAGNETTVTRTYLVADRPDAAIRGTSGDWVGTDVRGGWRGQQVVEQLQRTGATRDAVVRVRNLSADAQRVRFDGVAGNARFGVRYVVDGRNVTRQVVQGSYRSSAIAPGSTTQIRVEVTRTRRARPGDQRAFVIRTSTRDGGDAVAVVARARR